jgi:hypothetical protein
MSKQLQYTVLGPWDLWMKYKGSSGGYQFADPQAKFVWTHKGADRRSDMPEVWHRFFTELTLSAPTKATMHMVVDNVAIVYVNGDKVRKVAGGWQQGTSYPKIPITLKAGTNYIDIEAMNLIPPTPGGLLVSIIAEDGRVLSRTGDSRWRLETNVGSGDAAAIFANPPNYGDYSFETTAPQNVVTGAPQKDTLFGMDKKLAIALIVCLVLVLFGSSMMSMMMMR